MIAREATVSDSGKIDYVMVSFYLSLVAIGWLMIYAVGFKQGYETMEWGEKIKTPVGKQTMFIGISFIISLVVFSLDVKFWRVFAYPIYAVGIALLIAVLIFGREINGAKAWFSFGFFGFQPVEVAKIGTALALSSFLSTPSVSIKDSRSQMIVLGLIGVPVFFIMLQPDAGSMLVFLSFSIMLYREGLSPLPYIVGIGLITIFILALVLNANELVLYLMMLSSLLFAFNISDYQRVWIASLIAIILVSAFSFFNGQVLAAMLLMLATVLTFIIVHSRRGRFKLVFIVSSALLVSSLLVFATSFVFNNVLKKHQKERINVWLRPDKCDPRGAAYNLNNAKMAIGSGGLQGKGFLEGTMTQLSFIPEQHTDFIFCTIGEEQGFIGVFAVIGIYVLFLIRLITIGERQKSNFVRLYAYCLAGIFFFHFFINIGMTMGVMPVIGIPLPFVSAGGSSLMGFTAMLAILIKLDSSRYSV